MYKIIQMRKIYCYTDGSAVILKNPTRNGPGGFAAYFPDFYGKKLAYSMGFESTKTGRMEVMALLYAIRALPRDMKEKVELIVYSDSQYVTKSFTEGWLKKWISNNWCNASGEIKNKDLWQSINKNIINRPFLKLTMIHIKGHQLDKAKKSDKPKLLNNSHIVGNSIADRLADYKRHKKLLKSDKIF